MDMTKDMHLTFTVDEDHRDCLAILLYKVLSDDDAPRLLSARTFEVLREITFGGLIVPTKHAESMIDTIRKAWKLAEHDKERLDIHTSPRSQPFPLRLAGVSVRQAADKVKRAAKQRKEHSFDDAEIKLTAATLAELLIKRLNDTSNAPPKDEDDDC